MINIKSYIMDEFKNRVEIINQARQIMQNLCDDSTQSEITIIKSEYKDVYEFTIKYDDYEIKNSITIKEIYDWAIEKNRDVDYTIYEVIMNKIYGELDRQFDSHNYVLLDVISI